MPKRFSEETIRFVAAIDIGSAFSSYAYARKGGKYGVENEDIHVKLWAQEARVGLSRKAPTSLLLKKDGQMHSFGYEAEKRYIRMHLEEKRDFMYFQHIKIHLAQEHAKDDWKIPDVDGKLFSLKQLMVHSLRYMKEQIIEDICSDYPDTSVNHVSWMVTIPAIWTDSSKYFMRDATDIAGIPQRNMTLVLEPEAASIYCSNRIELLKEDKFSPLPEGTKFILADLGGCTLDISVQEVAKNGRMRLLLPPVGVPRGGIEVDRKFEELLCETFGKEAIEKFKSSNKLLYMKLLREFEMQKRQTKGDIRLTLPHKLKTIYEEFDSSKILYSRVTRNTPDSEDNSEEYCTLSTCSSGCDGMGKKSVNMNAHGSSIKYNPPWTSMDTSTYTHGGSEPDTSISLAGSLKISHEFGATFESYNDAQAPSYFYVDVENEEIVFSRGIFNQLFQEIVDEVLEKLKEVTETSECDKSKLIIMTGGLSESDILMRHIKSKFAPRFNIYRPGNADLVVLKGAVLLGLDPLAVTSRISRFTYGIGVFEDFDSRKHAEDKKYFRNDIYVCKDVFSKKFTIGEAVEVGSVTQFKVFDTFVPNREHKRVDPLRVDIFISERKEPRYTDDPTCRKLCSIIIEPDGERWPITVRGIVTFEVARTELIATFRDLSTERTAMCKFDFM